MKKYIGAANIFLSLNLMGVFVVFFFSQQFRFLGFFQRIGRCLNHFICAWQTRLVGFDGFVATLGDVLASKCQGGLRIQLMLPYLRLWALGTS
jgi:hypothetical protein